MIHTYGVWMLYTTWLIVDVIPTLHMEQYFINKQYISFIVIICSILVFERHYLLSDLYQVQRKQCCHSNQFLSDSAVMKTNFCNIHHYVRNKTTFKFRCWYGLLVKYENNFRSISIMVYKWHRRINPFPSISITFFILITLYISLYFSLIHSISFYIFLFPSPAIYRLAFLTISVHQSGFGDFFENWFEFH